MRNSLVPNEKQLATNECDELFEFLVGATGVSLFLAAFGGANFSCMRSRILRVLRRIGSSQWGKRRTRSSRLFRVTRNGVIDVAFPFALNHSSLSVPFCLDRSILKDMIRLTREQTEQAVQHPDGVPCQGDGVDKMFVIVDADVMEQMREAISRSDLAAIQAGINDMEAGKSQPAEEAQRHGRDELLSRFRS